VKTPPSLRLASLDELAQREVLAAGVAPAAVLAASGRLDEKGHWRHAVGAAGVRSQSRATPIDEWTPFDLASLTKPVVACAIARLIRLGTLDWSTTVGAVLPALRPTHSGEIPLEMLLAHRAGLSGHCPLYAPLLHGRPVDAEGALLQAAESRRPECLGAPPPDGFPPVYSDLGYIVAGCMASHAAGVSLDVLVEREVSGPLGLELGAAEAWAARRVDFVDRVAPTEIVPFRGGEIVGQVHDENAWALTGGALSGNAGLFGTAEAVARFGTWVVDALEGRVPGWLRAQEIEPLVRRRPGGTLRAGFDGRADEGSSAGTAFGPYAFGHLGFTGTSLWCDPDAGVVTVILTNRVSPSRNNVAIRRARPIINDALFRAARRFRQP
jgi:CubicO group peptidase (beta-lactamase class C family)